MTQHRRTAPRAVIKHSALGTALAVAVFALVSTLNALTSGSPARVPTPELNPAQVVEIQVAALRHNTPRDEGIAVAFRFASPENRDRTGPLGRFASMIRSEDYLPLLNHLGVQYGATVVRADRSYTPVIVTDRRGVSAGYLWVLKRETDASCAGCWMTDSVLSVGDLADLRLA